MRLEMLNRTFTLGIDLGGTATKVGLFTPIGNLIERIDYRTPSHDFDALLRDTCDQLEGLLARNGADPAAVTSIGVAVPAIVRDDGVLDLCVNVDLDLERFKECLHRLMPAASVAAINDANAAALGEVWQGGQRGVRDLVLVTLGTGIGAGIICDGALLLGHGGAAGEIGHLCIDPDESEPCNCGNLGCLEQYASGRALVQMVGHSIAQGKASLLGSGLEYGAKEVFDAAKAGDDVAQQAVDVFTGKLALALAQVACVLAPDVIVLGGGLSGSADVYIERLRAVYAAHAFSACRETPIVCASLGNSAGIYGATYHAMQGSGDVMSVLGDR